MRPQNVVDTSVLYSSWFNRIFLPYCFGRAVDHGYASGRGGKGEMPLKLTVVAVPKKTFLKKGCTAGLPGTKGPVNAAVLVLNEEPY